MILRAKHHPVVYPFFCKYSEWIIKRHFRKVDLDLDFEQKQSSVILLSNHLSWWDGFWAMLLNNNVIKRKFHFMMLEEQLRKYWFFNLSGGFSVRKSSRSVIESIDYCAELLEQEENMILLFPQGKIESQHQHEIRFESGIEHILARTKKPVQILFAVNLVDYFSQKKPTLSVYLTEYKKEELTTRELEKSYREFYSSCIDRQLKKAY